MREHVGRPVRVWQVAEVMNVAYGKAAKVQNAASGFKKTGLWPLTMDIYLKTATSLLLLHQTM